MDGISKQDKIFLHLKQNFTVTPSGNPTRPVQSHLEWQNQFFVGPANNYQASPNKK